MPKTRRATKPAEEPPANRVPKIAIADVSPLLRRGVQVVLTNALGTVECYEAATTAQLLQCVQQERPDIVLLSLNLPDLKRLEIVPALKALQPTLPVLLLGLYLDDQLLIRTLKAGVAGYLPLESSPEDLATAVTTVMAGQRYLPPPVAERLARYVVGTGSAPLHATLSNREYEVMCEIARGKTVSAIAQDLRLSVKTVSAYRVRMLRKLGLKNNTELIAYALRHHLVD